MGNRFTNNNRLLNIRISMLTNFHILSKCFRLILLKITAEILKSILIIVVPIFHEENPESKY